VTLVYDREHPGFRGAQLQPGAEGVFRAIYDRRSVRAYTAALVPGEAIEVLLEAAVHAPSAVNAQPWAFVVIQRSDMLDRYAREAIELLLEEPMASEVAQSGLPELDRLRQMVRVPGYQLFHGASTLIVVYATAPSGVPDCFLAAENLMLAAWAIDLGTCPIGLATPLFNRPDIKQELGVAPEWVTALPIVVGHPSRSTPPTSRHPPHIVAWR
jgi:nitroreductase